MKRRSLRTLTMLAAAMTLALAACTTTPDGGRRVAGTPAGALAYIEANVPELTRATEDALQRGEISPDAAADILKNLKGAESTAREAALLLEAGEVDDAEPRLAAAVQTLKRLEARLAQ